MIAKKEPPPWRAGQYTPLLNTLVYALVRSGLNAGPICTFLLIATETWGHTGEKWREYGRATAPVSAPFLAQKMHVHESTARRWLKELETEGWVSRVKDGRGRRAATWEPALSEPLVMVETTPTLPVGSTTVISDWLAQKKAEQKAEAARHGLGHK
jgi:hypothetical protein